MCCMGVAQQCQLDFLSGGLELLLVYASADYTSVDSNVLM